MPSPSGTPEQAHDTIRRFLAACAEPALLEPGEEQIALTPDNYHVELQSGRLLLQAWDDRRNLTRRVLAIRDEAPGRLELSIERFGKQTGTLELLDMARPRAQQASRRSGRLAWRDRFRRSLSRQFPGWTIRELSTEPHLEHSLSPAYPRALLTKGSTGWAAIGAPPDTSDPAAALTFGLIWLDYLRARERRSQLEGLALFVPQGRERSTCLRVRWLDDGRAQFRVYMYGDGYEAAADLTDYGNVDTELVPRRSPSPKERTHAAEIVERLLAVPGVELAETGDQTRSLRVRGLEFAREREGRLTWGLETKRTASSSNSAEMMSLARELARVRAPGAEPQNELYQRSPELWLESQVRSNLHEIDASLRSEPVYGQVPALAAADRGIIDLLAADHRGRLAVLELKASEDPHLPLQALDYWLRVRWHVERGEFSRNGYFPGLELVNDPPRMLLIAPALGFHPSTEIVLRYFSPQIEVERIGVGMDWRRELKTMFRIRGADTPRFEQEGTNA
jgi:hypothetical protein